MLKNALQFLLLSTGICLPMVGFSQGRDTELYVRFLTFFESEMRLRDQRSVNQPISTTPPAGMSKLEFYRVQVAQREAAALSRTNAQPVMAATQIVSGSPSNQTATLTTTNPSIRGSYSQVKSNMSALKDSWASLKSALHPSSVSPAILQATASLDAAGSNRVASASLPMSGSAGPASKDLYKSVP